MSTEREKHLLTIANASGFLFQLRVADLVEATLRQHGWQVLLREHPWADPSGSGFIDMILAHDRDSVRLVVECKRAKEGQWIILLADADEAKIRRTRSFVTLNARSGKEAGWGNCEFSPSSPESNMCIVRGTGESDSPLLERIAAMLSRATEFFGRQELD